jgi:nucleoside-diphosphate-sugar epimerase
MGICIITGSAGLIGAEAVRFFSAQGFQVVGIDNDMRRQFFGTDASTEWSRRDLESKIPSYKHYALDIRDRGSIEAVFAEYGTDIKLLGTRYTVLGYRGKQVRDNIHSFDLVNMFWEYYQAPRPGEVYNAGGGRFSNCSINEAIELCEHRTGGKMDLAYAEHNRMGDHIWYISDTRKFQSDYPAWRQTYDLPRIVDEIFESMSTRV